MIKFTPFLKKNCSLTARKAYYFEDLFGEDRKNCKMALPSLEIYSEKTRSLNLFKFIQDLTQSFLYIAVKL